MSAWPSAQCNDGSAASCLRCLPQAVVRDPSQELLPGCSSPKVQQQQQQLAAESAGSAIGSRSASADGSGSNGGGSSSSVWEALLHIVGAINYGGRVTDPEDRKLLAAIMQQHLSAEVLTGSIQLGQTGEDGARLTGGRGDCRKWCCVHR
jgi:hypothetical protein